jgi:uncharacterized protein (TIGR03086 family)
MDQLDVLHRAIDQTGRIVSGVQQGQLGDPTPCADWNVSALLNHTISVVMMFDGAASGAEFDGAHFANDNVGDDAGASYKSAADKLHATLVAPGVIDATWHMPFGPVPGEAAVGFATLEVAQHGWDVAKATGQQADFDPSGHRRCHDGGADRAGGGTPTRRVRPRGGLPGKCAARRPAGRILGPRGLNSK